MTKPTGKPRGRPPKQLPPSESGDKPKKRAWSGTWVDKATVERDPDGGTCTVAKVKTNMDGEIDKLHGLTRKFATIVLQAADGSPLNVEIDKYSLKVGKKPGSQVATITVRGHGNFSKLVTRQVTVDGAQKVLPIGEEQGEPR